MKISLVTDKNWRAISNENPIEATKFDKELYRQKSGLEHKGSHDMLDTFMAQVNTEDQIMTMFDYTELLPTYVYSFAVGPYLFIPG